MSTQVEREPEASSRSRTLGEIVTAAQQGEPGAFDDLVRRFQDMAAGTAYGWLRDPQQAQDAAQEAFVEAYCNLAQLEEPDAFPGFLKRIVLKHCDRRTRRRSVARLDLESAHACKAEGAEPESSLVAAEDRTRVRAAVEELPDGERLVVALHYLAGLTQAEVAAWLELPLSTVKKRLHTARGRLRDAMESMMEQTFEAMRPSRDSLFSETIQLFLAIRTGDTSLVARLLDREPDLLEAEERWDPGISHEHGLPVPNGGTPLVRAAERNQLEIIDALLDRGAAIDRPCPCAGGESPLWAAVANGQAPAARRLLERGASPDSSSFAGHTPLHVAALRGFADIVDVLCDFGADGRRRDRHGRTPRDWALEKGHARIVDALADRFGAESDAPRAGVGRAVAAEIGCATGIRSVDLLAPLAPGSIASVDFGFGQGAVVFLAELSTRWSLREGGSATLWVGWERNASDLGEMEHAFAELDLVERAGIVWSPASDDEARRRTTVARAVEQARALQSAGIVYPLVVVFAQPGRLTETFEVLPSLAPHGAEASAITLLVAFRDADRAAGEAPPQAPFDVRLAFDPALAAIGHFPAIHPLTSSSAHLASAAASPRHRDLAARSRSLLERHRSLVPDLLDGDLDSMTPDERQCVARARRLQAFLTQPFFVAESFTGAHGRGTSLEETLDDVEAILAGALDATPLGEIPYKGRLSEIVASVPKG